MLISTILLLALALSSCGAPPASQEDFFIPPTIAPEASPIVPVTPTLVPTFTATVVCTNLLSFLDDLTVPDGSAFSPGDPVEKVWLVQNEGTCNWEAGYTVRNISGEDLGADPEQALLPVRSGSEAEIAIDFTAPDEPGEYRTSWQAHDPQGNPFGDPFFMEIVVEPAADADEGAEP